MTLTGQKAFNNLLRQKGLPIQKRDRMQRANTNKSAGNKMDMYDESITRPLLAGVALLEIDCKAGEGKFTATDVVKMYGGDIAKVSFAMQVLDRQGCLKSTHTTHGVIYQLKQPE